MVTSIWASTLADPGQPRADPRPKIPETCGGKIPNGYQRLYVSVLGAGPDTSATEVVKQVDGTGITWAEVESSWKDRLSSIHVKRIMGGVAIHA